MLQRRLAAEHERNGMGEAVEQLSSGADASPSARGLQPHSELP